MSVNIIISTEYVQYVHCTQVSVKKFGLRKLGRGQILIFLAYLILAYPKEIVYD